MPTNTFDCNFWPIDSLLFNSLLSIQKDIDARTTATFSWKHGLGQSKHSLVIEYSSSFEMYET